MSPAGTWKIEASEQLSTRPIGPIIAALRHLGAHIDYLDDDGYCPIQVTAKGLVGGNLDISGDISSQFISGALLASPYAMSPVTINVTSTLVPSAYVNITMDLMQTFGASVTCNPSFTSLVVKPSRYAGKERELEADASTACYFFAYAALTGRRIRVANLRPDTNQPDFAFLKVLQKMGCTVIVDDGITVMGPDVLRGGFTIDMHAMSDQALTLCAIAPFADKPIAITNVGHIRYHESDRIQVACAQLNAVGVPTVQRQDGFEVYPQLPHAGVIDPHGDHRVAMAFSLIGAVVPGIVMLDPGCVSKTCPPYFDMLASLGVRVSFED